jgi:hypothetical protein
MLRVKKNVGVIVYVCIIVVKVRQAEMEVKVKSLKKLECYSKVKEFGK